MPVNLREVQSVRALGASVLLLACAPHWEEAPVQPRVTESGAPLSDRLAELADAVDPGPQPPLHTALSPWIVELIVGASPPTRGEELLEAIKQPLDGWDELEAEATERERVEALVGLARATLLAEQQLSAKHVDVEILFVLERAYHVFDQPHLAREEGIVARHLGVLSRMAVEAGRLDDQRKIPELVRAVRTAIYGAGALHRQTVARILRQAPEHPQVPHILARAARGVGHRNDELAVDMMRLSVEMRPPAAVRVQDRLELAALCFGALDLACGNEARQAAAPARREAGPQLRRWFQRVDELARLADEAARLSDRADAEARLRRAEILLALHRFDDAEELYRTLHRQHPEDARAVVGLARHAIASQADYHAAYQIIERSDASEHRDRAYYEIAIGTRATTIVHDVLPRAAGEGPVAAMAAAAPYLAKLRADVLAYEKLGAEDGVVLHFLLDRLDEAVDLLRAGKQEEIRARARALLPEARELHEKVPGNIHGYRILMSAAALSSDREAAFEVVDAPLPELGTHHVQGALRRATALFELAVAWERFDRIDDVLRWIDEVGPRDRDRRMSWLEAHALAVKARLTGDRVPRTEAYALYQSAPSDPTPAVVLHNAAVLLHEMGRHDDARQQWARALERVADDRRDIVRLHEVVGGPEPTFIDVEPFTRTPDEELRLLALRWAAHLAPAKQAPASRKALRKAETEMRRTTLRPTLPPGRAGVLLPSSLSFDLGYASEGGLDFTLDLVTAPWLVLAAPS
jgi:tetratricopeptide (TPR) repeat protein